MKYIRNLYNNEYAFSIISKVIGVLIGFLYSVIYSRYFGADLRGVAAIITNYIGLLYIFLCMGMYQAYPYYRKGLSDDEVENYYRGFINDSFGLFFVYLTVAVVLSLAINFDTIYKVVILLLPTEFLIKQLNYVVLIENPKLRNLTGLKLNLFELIFTILLAIFVPVNYAVCIIFIVTKQIVYLIFAIQNLKINIFSIRPGLSSNIIKFMKFGFIPMISTLLLTANYKIDVLMLGQFNNVTMSEVGIYSLGVQLAERVWMIPDALKDILLSKLSKGKSEKEVAKVIRISLPIMAVFVVGILLLGQPFIIFVYGAEYAGAYQVTIQILFGVICMVFFKMINSYYIVEGRRMLSFIMLSITTVANVILNALFISKFGMPGAALASLISYVLCGAMFVITFLHITNMPLSELFFIKKSDIQMIKDKLLN